MKKVIRCNETRYTNGADRDRIRYEFLSDDNTTPSSCTIRLGDIDPLTGEKITNLTFFKEYYSLDDHQVMKNLQASRPGYKTVEQKNRRDRMKSDYIAAFIADHGYAPSRSDVLWHLEQSEKERWNLSLDSLIDEENSGDDLDRHAAFSSPAISDEEESIQMQALREVAVSLTGRKAEVLEAMIQQASGGKVKLRFADIAKKWGVALPQISKEKERIAEMIRKKAEELEVMRDKE